MTRRYGIIGAAIVLSLALLSRIALAAPAAKTPSPLAGKIAVINACSTADISQEVAEELKGAGYTVAKVGKVPASTELTRVIYQAASEKLAQEVSKKIPGTTKLVKATTPVPGADILITIGCGTVKARQEARVKLLRETRVAVINACSTTDASKDIAEELKGAGYTVAKVGKIPASTELTRVIYQAASEKLAQEVSKKIPGTTKLVKATAPVPGADILLTVGCQTAVAMVERRGKAALPTVARALPPRGIFPSSVGGSGLIASRSADVLPMGSYGASGFVYSTFHLLPDEYRNAGVKLGGKGGLPDKDIDLQMSFNWGIWKRVEVGAMFPVSLASGTAGGFGIRNVRVIGRGSLYDKPSSPSKVAASAFVGVPTAGKDVGSGNSSLGAEINYSYLFGERRKFSVNANVGYELSDYISKAFPEKAYESVSKLAASGSLGYIAAEKLLLSLEFLYSSALGKGGSGDILSWGDDDLFSVIGARVLPTKNIALGIAGGFGLPLDTLRDDTNYLVIAGGSYLFGKLVGAAVALPEAPPKPSISPAAQPAKPAFVPPPAPLPSPAAPVAPPPVPAPKKKSLKDMRVEVRDACGKPAVRDSVGKILITGGFNVVKLGEAPQKGATLTEILYLKEYEPEALVLKKGLKGTPKLTPRTSGDVEITVLVGCDQVP